MSAWKRMAIEAAPELRKALEDCPTPMSVWIELRWVFETYVRAGDKAGIERIMRFARYCMSARDIDVRTAVAVGFLEHLPESDAVRTLIPELLSLEEIRDLKPVLAYHVGDAAGAEIAAEAERARNGLVKPHRRKR